MGRLNQVGRNKIGYIYNPQVINDVTLQPKMRNMSYVQDKVFEQNIVGEGLKENIRTFLDTSDKIGKKAYDLANSDGFKKASKIVFDNLPTEKQEKIKNLSEMAKTGSKLIKDIRGDGLNVAGGSRGSIQPSVGGGIDIRGNQEGELPGDMLKKKLLKKMMRERKMKSLGDRVKTQPIESGMNGGSLVIPTINNKMGSQSMSKTLPDSGTYKLNPKPLVGAGQHGGFIISGLIALGSAIAAAASAAASTTIVGGVTAGTIAGAALTGAAGAAGQAVMKKALGKKGEGIKDTIVKVAKETKMTYKDLSPEDKEKLKKEFSKLKKDQTKEGLINFSKAIAPIALKITKQKLKPKITKVFKKMGLSGGGLGLAGKGEKKFKNEFVKNMLLQLRGSAP